MNHAFKWCTSIQNDYISYNYSSPPLIRPPLIRPLQPYDHFLYDGCILFFDDTLTYDHSRSRHTTTKMGPHTTTEPFFHVQQTQLTPNFQAILTQKHRILRRRVPFSFSASRKPEEKSEEYTRLFPLSWLFPLFGFSTSRTKEFTLKPNMASKKRTRVCLTLEDKVNVIRRSESGGSARSISANLGTHLRRFGLRIVQ